MTYTYPNISYFKSFISMRTPRGLFAQMLSPVITPTAATIKTVINDTATFTFFISNTSGKF